MRACPRDSDVRALRIGRGIYRLVMDVASWQSCARALSIAW